VNVIAACGLIAMLIALWIGQGQPYPENGFAVGMFAAGAVALLLSDLLYAWAWAARWRWEDRRDEARAAQEEARAAEGEPFGGQWE
jgi:hypothetical protein